MAEPGPGEERPDLAGLTLDGAAAWVVSEPGRTAGAVDPRTGDLLWERRPRGEDGPFNGDVWQERGLMVLRVDDRIAGRSLTDGALRWERPADGAARVDGLGGDGDVPISAGDAPLAVAVAVATVDGEVTVHTVQAYGQLLRDREGLLLLGGGRVRTVGPGGATREIEGPDSGTWTVTPTPSAGSPGARRWSTAEGTGAGWRRWTGRSSWSRRDRPGR